MPEFDCVPYPDMFLVQGNDGRGQETGLLTRGGYKIANARTFVNELDGGGGLIYNNNFVRYEIISAAGEKIWLLTAHLQEKEKDKDFSDALRFSQCEFISEVYEKLKAQGQEKIIVAGTFNGVSYCYSLSPIIQKTDLRDISKHPSFNVAIDSGKDAAYFRMGAYRMGVNLKQKDYLLLSPELFRRVKSGGLNRKGIWPERPHQ